MKEGWWINFETGRYVALKCRGLDHEGIIRNPQNQQWLGLPRLVIADIYRFKPVQDRDSLLLHILTTTPLMRIRGHGAYITFEFSSEEEFQPLDTIRKWARKNAGEATVLNIVNFSGDQVRAVSVLPDQLGELGTVPSVSIDAFSGSVNWRRSGIRRKQSPFNFSGSTKPSL